MARQILVMTGSRSASTTATVIEIRDITQAAFPECAMPAC
jgi:hypothetical protein